MANRMVGPIAQPRPYAFLGLLDQRTPESGVEGAGGEAPRAGDPASLQKIRAGVLSVAGNDLGRLLAQIRPELNDTLTRLGLLKLLSGRPSWGRVSRRSLPTTPLPGG